MISLKACRTGVHLAWFSLKACRTGVYLAWLSLKAGRTGVHLAWLSLRKLLAELYRCTFWSLLYCCTGVHRLSAGEVRHQTRPVERHVSDPAAGCRYLWPCGRPLVSHQSQQPPLRGQMYLQRLATTATEYWNPWLCRLMQANWQFVDLERDFFLKPD